MRIAKKAWGAFEGTYILIIAWGSVQFYFVLFITSFVRKNHFKSLTFSLPRLSIQL